MQVTCDEAFFLLSEFQMSPFSIARARAYCDYKFSPSPSIFLEQIESCPQTWSTKFQIFSTMEPQVIWIGIDPSLLIEGFDYQRFFGADTFLKFNINPDEIESKDNRPENTTGNSINHPTVKSDKLDTIFNGDIKDIKSEQENIKLEDQSTARSQIKSNKQGQNGGIPSMCPECGLAVSSMTKLEEHVRIVHNTSLRFPCDHCDKKLSRKRLLEHKQVVFGMELRISCKICQKMFTRKRDLEAHIGKMHPEEITMPHQCNICLKVLRSSETLKYHERQNHREPVAQCKTCSKKFSTQKNYDLHMLQAFCDPAKKKKREKQCDKCDMRFRRKHDLDCHTDSTHSDREYPCKSEGCQKVVTSYRRLKYHMMERHNEENFNCAICHRKFAKESSLDIHVKSESCKMRLEKKREAARSGQFKCTFEKCEKQYLTKTHLDRHIMIHTDERPYQCDNCGMAFHQKGSLKEHIRLHTGEKPYQCQACPNAYAQGGTFKAHLKTHNDAKSAPDHTEVKTFKSKHANFRDYYLRETYLGTITYSGRGRPPHLKTHIDDKSATELTEIPIEPEVSPVEPGGAPVHCSGAQKNSTGA